MMGIAPYYSTASYILAVVPLFILMGELACIPASAMMFLIQRINGWAGCREGWLSA